MHDTISAPSLHAIETHFLGRRFRSRLEARWAAFFHHLGVEWDYEPEGFALPGGRYLPDFRVVYPDGAGAWYYEVKPSLQLMSQPEWAKALELDAATDRRVLLLDGSPNCRMYLRPSEAREGGASASEHARFGWALWSYKKRPWWDEHENYYDDPAARELGADAVMRACAEANSHRFGERGAA